MKWRQRTLEKGTEGRGGPVRVDVQFRESHLHFPLTTVTKATLAAHSLNGRGLRPQQGWKARSTGRCGSLIGSFGLDSVHPGLWRDGPRSG
jgi:hypothetical protein